MPLPENTTQARIRPISIIVHTQVGNPTLNGARGALLGSNAEHHFNLRVGGVELAQYVDTEVRADNNFQANSFQHEGQLAGAISIETGDRFYDGDPKLERSFTDLDQFDALVDLIAWCCRTHDIPATMCSAPWDPGIGFHSMWGYNKRGKGKGTYGRYKLPHDFGGGSALLNNPWTNALGKTCPGDGKINEFPRLLAAVQHRLGSAVAVDSGDAAQPGSASQRTAIVRRGDGWMSIARRDLKDETRWQEVRNLNADRPLYPGDTVLLPAA